MENFSQGAEWTTRYKNDLPDSAFLYIEAGGKRDSEGKIKPRSLRHFPYKDADGKVDRAHILNAIARIPQAKFLSQAQKDRLQARARKIYLNWVKKNSKKANSFVDILNKLSAAVGASERMRTRMDESAEKIKQKMDPATQEVYDIIGSLYSSNECVMKALGDLTVWSSGKRGDWKPDFMRYLKNQTEELRRLNPIWSEDVLRANLMSLAHQWFEGYAPQCFGGTVLG
jgi:hypothetical protein